MTTDLKLKILCPHQKGFLQEHHCKESFNGLFITKNKYCPRWSYTDNFDLFVSGKILYFNIHKLSSSGRNFIIA